MPSFRSGVLANMATHHDVPLSLRPPRSTRVVTATVLVIAAVLFLAPVYWLLISSTKSNADLISSNGLLPAKNNIVNNYQALISWTQGNFWRWVANSVLYSTVAGVVGTLVSVSAGYALSKFRMPGSKTAQLAILGGLLMPIALLTVPLYIFFNGIGITNTVWSVIIPSCVSPFGVFLGLIFVQAAVPDELLEAARLDGSGELRTFFTLVLRLLAPAMVTIFLFIFVATWNNFLLPLMMLTSPELKPVTVGLYGMMSYFNPQYGAVMQGALLSVVPLILMFLVLQRYWQSGLAAGAVKG